ncbi:hypothetical protein ABBQ38_002597 [Trebouxia sp. C0009 RCD-2024]
MVSKRERKPKVQWQEHDIHAPVRIGRKITRHVPAPRHKAPLKGLLPQASPGSPMSDDSAATRMNFAPRTSHKRSTAPVTKERASKPLKAESPAWRIGVEDGLFPGTVLCNKHGALDGRDRLWRYVDAQSIWDLQQSNSMPDEEKAALSLLCYWDPKGKASSSSEGVEAAGSQGRADAGQPWGAQSPTHHNAPAQAASAASEQQPAVSQAGVGGRKRKRASSDDSHSEQALHAPRSKRRQLFAEPGQGSGKSNSGSLLLDAVDLWLQQADVDSHADMWEEDDAAHELCMHRVSSSDSEMQME